jgi:hypothetical protein
MKIARSQTTHIGSTRTVLDYVILRFLPNASLKACQVNVYKVGVCWMQSSRGFVVLITQT